MVNIIATSGKGGVGKSTISHAIAASLAHKGTKTLIIDCDKNGKATERTLFPSGDIKIEPNRISSTGVDNLYAGAISPLEFWDLPRMEDMGEISAKKRNEQFGAFMNQFPREYGLVAYNVLFNQFFGVSSNPEQVADFISLMRILGSSERMGIEQIILDLEPTKGMKRMLGNATQTAKTLKAMSEYSMAKVVTVGVQFPDIKRFLKTDYMKNAKVHGDSLMKYVGKVAGADYVLVCGPEGAMVDEMLEDTEPIIRSYGGKTSGYVVNNCRGNLDGIEASMQEEEIGRVQRRAAPSRIPVYKVWHDSNLNSRVSDKDRISHLRGVGDYLTR